MLASLADNSLKQYDVYFKKWFDFCVRNCIDCYGATIMDILTFLTTLFNNGYQYGSLNSCKAALSLILGSSVSRDDRIIRFLKGAYRLRPPTAKYSATWDTSCVLSYLASQYPNKTLGLEKLTKKCITLLALVTAHRVQTLSKILVTNIEIKNSEIIIKIPDLIKTSKIGATQPLLVLPYFSQKKDICPAETLVDYINRTVTLRSSESLFIGYRKPHKAVSTQSLCRWIKSTLKESGIDVSIFSAHSTRHAATSKAHQLGVNIDQIRRTAGWSENSDTFFNFYNKKINKHDPSALARAIINDCDLN